MKKKLNFLCILALSLLAVGGAWTGGECVKGFILFNKSLFSGGDVPEAIVVITMMLALFIFYFLIRAFISFIRFIVNVNRDKVFVKENLSLLRWTGKGILIYNVVLILCELPTYFVMSSDSYINKYGNTHLLGLKNHMIDNGYFIIFAIFCLIIAEVFAIGIKLKEEQDLTI